MSRSGLIGAACGMLSVVFMIVMTWLPEANQQAIHETITYYAYRFGLPIAGLYALGMLGYSIGSAVDRE